MRHTRRAGQTRHDARPRRSSHVWTCGFAIVALVCARVTWPAEGDPGERAVRVVCPALRHALDPGPNAPPDFDGREPQLVAVVRAVEAGRDAAGLPAYRYEVEKVLYGSHAGKAIRLTRIYPHGKQLIVACVPALDGAPGSYVVLYQLPASEEKAERALCQARMAYCTLASTGIFVGRETALGPEATSSVAVVRAIHGAQPTAGSTVAVRNVGLRGRRAQGVAPVRAPRLYFVSGPSKDNWTRQPAWDLITRLPLDQEAKVRAALARRDEHPVFEREVDGETLRFREIIFRGPAAEAIELLAARGQGAVSLGYRSLMHRRKEARPAVVAAVERAMFRLAPAKYGQFQQLQTLVRLLGDVEREDGRGHVRRLIEKQLAHVERGAPEPPAYQEAGARQSEETRADINRSFTWLLLQLDEGAARRTYGPRLLALRQKAKGRWTQEVQVALDALRVEDAAELDAAMARLKGHKAVRSTTGLRLPNGGGVDRVLFSHDGKLLATAGHGGQIGLWNAADWSRAAVIEQQGSIEALAFSPDDRLLYVAGGGGGLQVHARFDTRTGKLDRAYEGHKAGIARMVFTPDFKTMVTTSYYEDKGFVWDTESGRVLRSFRFPRLKHEVRLSRDGTVLFRHTADGGTVAETLAGKPVPKAKLPKDASPSQPFSASDDGYACRLMLKGTFSHGGTVVLFATGRQPIEIGRATLVIDRPSRAALSAKAERLAVAGSHTLWLFSLPTLRLINRRRFPSRGDTQDLQSLAFSPDGRRLAVASNRAAPFLFDAETFKEIRPYDGHAGRTTSLCFARDGKRLRTVGGDNSVCTWDAATLKMLRRFHLPDAYEPLSVREPHGRYAACFDAAKVRSAYAGGGEQTCAAKVLDLDTGATVCELVLPLGRFATRLHWIDDRLALLATRTTLCRFDYRAAKILGRVAIDDPDLGNGRGDLVEDGRALFIAGEGGKAVYDVRATVIDVQTGKATAIRPDAPRRVPGQTSGLVPGGKRFYIADPNVYIFDRRTCQRVAERSFKGTDLLGLSFSGDGGRYAVVTGARVYVTRRLGRLDPGTRSIVRVHHTLSGKTLFAFPASTRWASVKLSPDGRRLAVINDDGTIELHHLPAPGQP